MTEEQLKSLPEPTQELYRGLERRIIDRICKRLNEVGQLSSTDYYKLDRITKIGGDIEAIKRDISNTNAIAEKEIYQAFYMAAKDDYEYQQKMFELLNRSWTPFDKSSEMLDLVEAMSRVTSAEFTNLTHTTGFVGDIAGLKKVPPHWKELAEYYQEAVDFAAFQIRTGITDYYNTVKETVRQLSDNGLSYIEYDNAGKKYYKRRLDSSVRNAVNGGLQRLSVAQGEIVGNEFGADGMEISAHSGARESHQWFQGLQFSMLEFHRDIKSLLNEYNCYHRAFPIILGVSAPAYTQKELNDIISRDKETHFYQDKEYNAYEARQKQRQLETAIRTHKDRAKAFAAVGNKEVETIAIIKASELQKHYKSFSHSMGLSTRPDLLTVTNFSRSQSSTMGAVTRKSKALDSLVGLTTNTGVSVNTISFHALEQSLNRKIRAVEIKDALMYPLHTGIIRADDSQQFVGWWATASINVETGKLISVWSTGGRLQRKYGGGKN